MAIQRLEKRIRNVNENGAVMSEQKHIVEEIIDYAIELGHTDIGQTEGLWEHEVDETWKIQCNPHKEKVDNVPPLCFTVEFNGWPAGILSLAGEGIICAGTEGNAENLRKAMQNRIKQEKS